MTKTVKTVTVINTRDRVFNGIQPKQITTIPADELQAYQRMGFQKFTPRVKKVEKKKQADRWNPRVNDAITFLQDKGESVPKSWKTSQILDKAKELWRTHEDEASDDQGNDDVEKAKAFLEEQGTTVGSRWKDDTIITKAKEAGWEPEVEQPADGAEDDLETLEEELEEEDKADK